MDTGVNQLNNPLRAYAAAGGDGVEPALKLLPVPSVSRNCPRCGEALDPVGVCIPGMRSLAELVCGTCGGKFFGDLPTGHGLPYPALLEADTGKVHHNGTLIVFAEYLAKSFAQRSAEPVGWEVESFRPLRKPVFLNCLDWLYGHSLLKLLNAQFHIDHQPGYDLVILVPRFLRWLVPAGAAEVWTVDIPLSKGWVWNDWLAGKIAERMTSAPEWWLSPAFSHPKSADFSIDRFTGVAPFPLEEWKERTIARPTVTYVWRGDRDWMPADSNSRVARVKRRVDRRTGWDVAKRVARITAFAELLRGELGDLDFAVTGLDLNGSFPAWIRDLRNERPTAEVERAWCERFAASHVVVGVHGSNMLLPSAHAGGLIEFVPDLPWDSRWGNIVEDVLGRGDDPRDAMFRHRYLPVSVEPEEAARIAASLIRDRPASWPLFDPEINDHRKMGEIWRGLPEVFRIAEP